MKAMKKPPILYLFIYKTIKEHSGGRPFVSYGVVREILKRRLYKIPANIRYLFLQELEELKLLRKIGNTNDIKYELIGKNVDKLILNHTPFF